MSQTDTSALYADEAVATIHRLVRNLRQAVEDGTWGASETASLSMWCRAEFMPWARGQVGQLPEPESAGHLLRDLAALDAHLLGTAGHAAVDAAEKLETAARRLSYAVRPTP